MKKKIPQNQNKTEKQNKTKTPPTKPHQTPTNSTKKTHKSTGILNRLIRLDEAVLLNCVSLNLF